ncbi:type I-E CRISPR-associated protein Cse2/CasB [Lactiplantibacillus mudanjiangensis]|uniref:Type I-E CRISPR-associated protein Cse2/CasB [Lactobacillus brevis] n=1 Tax=Lactiplantibacillus mudanjiangensis TaxID=1296538 RepID=A0A660E1T5_9LACO|nr:type I-E CRISPR-associated protein Cse2/CasB [Lactiplantibacillus mudanjiangensis]VDG22728.1 type I-E CRISPR-associated protein Cse2/CasB [Lactobacillus brevis] [Lactiplantibacillus mudanjiangensis]VDG26735.1 type I-E CRISPR-associated protein Cse2/CasB [Lactobacillus brevis] [Lactiplantibacillus mudanjiangensis]
MMYEIERTTDRIIIRRLYRNGDPDKAVLAGLKNATSMASPHAQVAWPLIMANLDKKYLSRSGEPTQGEVAVYTAIRFYALHQQGQDQCVYASARAKEDAGQPLFEALAKLRQNTDMQTRLDNRVKPLLATSNAASVINSLAQLVKILKSANKSQKIDYALLAQDLYGLQGSYEQSNRTRLRWGQQYYWSNQATVEIKGDQNHD